MLMDLSSFLDDSDNLFSFKGELEEIKSDLKERGIKIVGPIEYEGEIFKVHEEMSIEFRITFNYEDSCSRCLKTSTEKVKTTLSGKLVEGKRDDKIESESEKEYDYDEEEIFYYQNDVLNLKDDILNQIIVSLPMKTLCSKDCKGLCSLCGINLNDDTCECVHDNIDPRLKVLENFFPKK